MRKRSVGTVSSDEEHVRLDLYEGRIPLGEAGDKLLELALAQHHRVDRLARLCELFATLAALQAEALTPWPVRWWRWIKKAKAAA